MGERRHGPFSRLQDLMKPPNLKRSVLLHDKCRPICYFMSHTVKNISISLPRIDKLVTTARVLGFSHLCFW